MKKIDRAIKDFAEYRREAIKSNGVMNPGIKTEILRRINVFLYRYENGEMTPCEIMRKLSSDCMRDGENMSYYWSDIFVEL